MAGRRTLTYGLIKPQSGAQLDRGDSMAVGLGAMWLLNEGRGGLIFDSTGTQPQSGFSGGTWSRGDRGWATGSPWQSATFGPLSQSVALLNWTVRVRAKTAALPNNLDIYDLQYTGLGNNAGPRMEVSNTGTMSLVLNYPTLAVQTVSSSIAANTWYDIVVVVSGSAAANYTLTCWLNSVQVLQATGLSSSQVTFTPGTFRFGGGFNNLRNWNGILDTAAVWNRALRPSEVLSLKWDGYRPFRPLVRRLGMKYTAPPYAPNQSLRNLAYNEATDVALSLVHVRRLQSAASSPSSSSLTVRPQALVNLLRGFPDEDFTALRRALSSIPVVLSVPPRGLRRALAADDDDQYSPLQRRRPSFPQPHSRPWVFRARPF